MKYNPSIAFDEMSGSAKGLTNEQILAWNAAANTAQAQTGVFFIPTTLSALLINIITHAPTVQRDCRGIFISINREFTPPFSSLRKGSSPRTVQLCGHSGAEWAALV